MAKDNNIQVAGNLTDNFRGYAALLRGIKHRVPDCPATCDLCRQ